VYHLAKLGPAKIFFGIEESTRASKGQGHKVKQWGKKTGAIRRDGRGGAREEGGKEASKWDILVPAEVCIAG